MDLGLEVIECIAKHNITVQQLKKVFRLLHTQGDHRAKYANQILTMLNELYASADLQKPDHSYLMVPPSSGIKLVSTLPPTVGRTAQIDGIVRFPGGGYTIALWFNLSSLLADWIMPGGRSALRE